MTNEPDEPTRFTVPMTANFRQVTTKEQAIGNPMRWRIEGDVMMQGVVVDWVDEDDGTITLTIEGAAPIE